MPLSAGQGIFSAKIGLFKSIGYLGQVKQFNLPCNLLNPVRRIFLTICIRKQLAKR